jgi:hypothetical protein
MNGECESPGQFLKKKKRRNIGANDNLLGYQSDILRFAKSFLFTRALLVPIAAFQPNTVQLPEDPRDSFENNETLYPEYHVGTLRRHS